MTPRTSPYPPAATYHGPEGNTRLLAAGPTASLATHLRVFGPMDPARIDASLIDELQDAGLSGRGGAAFASWRKLAATAGSGRALLPGRRAVVIANGAEGEPLSFKDKTLLANAPHLVIDGLLACGRAVRATSLYLYATTAQRPVIERALAQRTDARRITVAEAPERFISGEASAVVNQLANGIALPMDKALRLSESGFRGRPTLVLNLETMAHIGLIARFGAAWFRSAGTDGDPGTRLLSLSGSGAQQVLEVPGGAVLGEVLDSVGIKRGQVQAVLVGGYHGRWTASLDLALSPGGEPEMNVRPGAGVLHVLPPGRCGLVQTAGIVEYLAGESARQCGPCMYGLPAMARTLRAIASRDASPQSIDELRRLGALVGGRGACHHPDGTLQLVNSALETFAGEIRRHMAGGCL
ncbi:MAG: NADH-ubiquinone oxidoreductase-F iron-sulfur binding region domain-containing protein, partial [Micrococcaceae bacterium]|nr:NADH-ubiquinone oxidoreductase-F iron-sulfur binding region domain-containing protein [Micrococcaceae bacterium]